MNRLSKEKRNQVVLVGIVTLGVLAGLYMGLIRFQQSNLAELRSQQKTTNDKLSQIGDAIRNNTRIESDLAAATNALGEKEADMIEDDAYLWMHDVLSKFKQPYEHLVIQQYTPRGATDMNLMPKFPYRQFTLGIMGTGYYHDIGKFIADFENRFPTSRVVNLQLSPDPSSQDERLVYHMDIITLMGPQAHAGQ
jgi:hypothetical protein